jgi:transcriptional regulator with XRE-family HTH domain
MSPDQCRMARAALKWNIQQLAAKAGVGVNTVNRFEAGHDARMSSFQAMVDALNAAGIVFTSKDGQECVCFGKRPGASPA